MRETRQALSAARDDPAALLPEPGAPPRVLAVGDALPDLPGSARRAPALPVDVSRTIENLLTILPLDVCHVHEPFAPSTSSAALRHSRALNVGTFHAPTERLLSTQVARKVVAARARPPRRAHGELRRDARAHAALLPRRLPRAAARRRRARAARRRAPAAACASASSTTRSAPRCGCSCARCAAWTRRRRGRRRSSPRAARRAARRCAPTSRRACATRRPASSARPSCSPRSDVLVAASDGAAPAPGLLLRAHQRRRGAARLAPAGLRGGARRGRARPAVRAARHRDARRASSSGSSPTRALRERLRDGRRAAARAADVGARRRRARGRLRRRSSPAATRSTGDTALAARLRPRPRIDVDLHMHTDHSHDCATPVEVLLATAREQGLGAIAVTDHNEVSGALEAREKAAEFGVKVIVAEEVKTANQGEVIGLFIEEKIPRGMTLAETVAEIKRQGGLVYVPASVRPHARRARLRAPADDHRGHRRDRGLQPARRDRLVQRGGRSASPRKYRILAGRRLGLARRARAWAPCACGCTTSTAPEEFLESLRDGRDHDEAVVAALRAGAEVPRDEGHPARARARAVRERRVRRATRKS